MKNNAIKRVPISNVSDSLKQFLLVMKLTTILLVITLVQVSAKGLSQNISITGTNMPIKEVLKSIEKQSLYTFFYDIKDLPNMSISVDLLDVPIDEVLSVVFKNVPDISYKIVKSNVVITKAESQKKITVKGIVIDDRGIPIPGVSVIIKNTVQGTATDAHGSYSIEVEGSDTLLFSCLGMKPVIIFVNNQGVINVTMEGETAQLDEVVVTGYQTISKERCTGSFTKVSGDQLGQKRLSNLNAVLEGQVAGYSNGLLRGTTSMYGMTSPLYVIDGFPVENTRYDYYGSLQENLPNLNLEDIESITVLKDAAATSIYGARAANGVIVVTTKKASREKTEISFSSNVTITPYSYYTKNLTDAGDIIGLEKEWATGNPHLQVSADGNGFITDADANSYALSLLENGVHSSQGMHALLDFYSGAISESDLNNKLETLSGRGYNYYRDVEKYAKRNSVYQNYNLNVGKASKKNSFNLSATYKENKYEDIYSNDESIGINVRNSSEITNWLTVDVGSYIYYNNATAQTYSALNPKFQFQPYDGLVDDAGNPYTSTAASRLSVYTMDNIINYGLYSMDITPLDELGMNLKRGKDFSSRSYAKLNFDLTDWLKYSSSFQYEYGTNRVSLLKDKKSYSVRNMVNGMVTVSADDEAVFNLPYGDIFYYENQYSNAYNFRNQIDLHKTFAEKHSLTMLAGSEVRHSKLEYTENTLYGYDQDLLSFIPVDQNRLRNTYGTLIEGVRLTQKDFALQRELVDRYVSFYTNASYTYDDRYTATGSLRWDRSNLWGTNSKYQNKPSWSVGFAWSIDKESFFKVDWIDMLKLRGSYGIGGNIAKQTAPYQTAYYYSNTNVGGICGALKSRPNPNLSWEKTTTTNVGVDYSIQNGRIYGSLEFYNKKGRDLLANSMGVPTEGWGYSTYTINNGEMRNWGYEATVNALIVRINNFEWDASLIYGYNKNEVTYVNVEAPVYFAQIDYPMDFPRIGNSYNTIYGYKWAGLSSTGLPQVYDSDGNKTSYQPTDLESIVSCGSAVPIHSGSFGSTFRYKNLELSCLFIFEAGHKIRNTNLPFLANKYSPESYSYIPSIGATNKKIDARWRKPGDEARTDIPRVVFEYDPEYSEELYTIYSLADINVIDASHIRLSNVSLSYHLPSSICEKFKLQDVRLNFNIENLYTFAASKDAKYMLGGYLSPNYVCGINLNF